MPVLFSLLEVARSVQLFPDASDPLAVTSYIAVKESVHTYRQPLHSNGTIQV